MKITVTASIAKEMFKNYDRDYYTIEAIESILDYYDENGEADAEFDVIAICCDWTEYEPEYFIEQFKYMLEDDFDIKDLNKMSERELIQNIIEKLEDETYVVKLENNNILAQSW